MTLKEALKPFAQTILNDAKGHKELWSDRQLQNPLHQISFPREVTIQNILDLAEAIEKDSLLEKLGGD